MSSPYLTYEEYKAFGFEEFDTEMLDEFPRFLNRASHVLDWLTRKFYWFTDLENDIWWRKDAFKRAVGVQIEYFLELDGFTTESLNSAPQTQQIGRTKIGVASKADAQGALLEKELASPDVHIHLEGTGLLNRGLG